MSQPGIACVANLRLESLCSVHYVSGLLRQGFKCQN